MLDAKIVSWLTLAMVKSITVELTDENAANISLGNEVTWLRPQDTDPKGSERLVSDMEAVCRAESGNWQGDIKRTKENYGTGMHRNNNKHYYPQSGFQEWIIYLAELPTHGAALGALILLLQQSVTQWLKNKGNRRSIVQIGDIKIEVHGDGKGIEDVIRVIRQTPELAVALDKHLSSRDAKSVGPEITPSPPIEGQSVTGKRRRSTMQKP